ncbi:MAG: amidohydrolase [Deltaproteobacteria bacterium]|nr:amidohydrolase [Deltaproteobacteria bacterium]
MMIDIFAHIIPLKYIEAVKRLSLINPDYIDRTRSLSDLDIRFRIMDKYDAYLQVLTIPGFHRVIAEGKEKSVELAKMANDSMAELVSKYPDRFVAAVASLPLNDMDAALKEAERAINDLHFRGVEIWATNEKPLDMPEFMPLYEEMCRYNLPIWIHPMRMPSVPDYTNEKESKYGINSLFGWVYETTTAMTRLVFGQVLQKYPDIKFITHHCGAMIPYLSARIVSHYDNYEMIWGRTYNRGLTKHPIEYFRMFYNDTAVNGNTAALNCGYDFFGVERLLFATDMPFDSQLGDVSIRETIRSIEEMDIPDVEKKMIFEDNARRLMRLPV